MTIVDRLVEALIHVKRGWGDDGAYCVLFVGDRRCAVLPAPDLGCPERVMRNEVRVIWAQCGPNILPLGGIFRVQHRYGDDGATTSLYIGERFVIEDRRDRIERLVSMMDDEARRIWRLVRAEPTEAAAVVSS